MHRRWMAVVFGCSLIAQNGDADGKRTQFEAEVARVYGFRADDLKREEQEQRWKQMQAFEAKVAADRDAMLPLLRERLQAADATAIFRLDGARILAKLSSERTDHQIAADSLAKAERKGLSNAVYFHLAHYLAVQGADITAVVESILDTDQFSVYLTDHVITLGKDACCYYCTLAMTQETWIDTLCTRLPRETSSDAVLAIIGCLRETYTDRATKALLTFAQTTKDEKLAAAARRGAEYGKQTDLPALTPTAERDKLFPFLEAYLNREYTNDAFDFDVYLKEAPYLVVKADYAKLKELRRKQAARVSDEALEEIGFLSRLIELAHTAAK